MARGRSASPDSERDSAAPLSKRDKRRAMLSQNLQDTIAAFSDKVGPHCAAQTSAIHVDMKLIMHADPYANAPLDDSPEAIQSLIGQATGGEIPADPDVQSDYLAQVGKLYSQFVDEVNDAMEDRDAGMTLLNNRYESGIRELDLQHRFKVHLAHEEHKLLASTIRERLIQSITTKRARLLKDKEQLDISDSNALLLHPNHFSIAHPGSPGGPQGNRKTRHTRHRAADPDDIGSAAPTLENKRKRKHAEDADDASPAPASRHADTAGASPFHVAKAKQIFNQYEAPAYSISNIFTEKELSMYMNTAAIATTNFFTRLQNQDLTAQANGSTVANGTVAADVASNSPSGAPVVMNEPETAAPEEERGATPLAAPEMDRTASSYSHHATRGATRALGAPGLNPLDSLAAIAASASASDTRPLPPSFPVQSPIVIPTGLGSKAANAQAPPPPQASADELQKDLALMLQNRPVDDPVTEELYERACEPVKLRDYQYRAPEDFNGGRNGHVDGPSLGLGLEALAGGVPMSAQSSVAGNSEMGGQPMSRTTSAMDTRPGLKRTGSGVGSGHLGVEAVGRRGRGRGGHHHG